MVRRALVVDDEAIVRQVTMRLLSELGFQCVGAGNGRLAQEFLRESNYDLVVTDLRMPEVNGHALAMEILQRPNRPVVVVLTGVTEPRLEQDLRTRGVDEILFKPVENEVFGATIRNLMECRQNLQEQWITDETDAPISDRPPCFTATKESHPSIAASVCEAIAAYPTPPREFDGFRQASGRIFDLPALEEALRLDSSLATLVLQLANSIVYFAQRTTKVHLLPNPSRDLLHNRAGWLLAAFFFGLLMGCVFMSLVT